MTQIDIAVVERLVIAFGEAIKACPTITGVRLGGDGFEPIIIVDSKDEGEEVDLTFPPNYRHSLPID